MRVPRRLGSKLLAASVLLVAVPVLAFLAFRTACLLAVRVLERRYPPPGALVAVGGHRLHLYCQGAGAPAVVIEPGLGVDWVAWQPVIGSLAATTTVCVYDRAGYGWSDPGPLPRTAGTIAAELHRILTARAGEQQYVLVAHSFGGYVARIFASRHPGLLNGVVLIDPSLEDFRATSAPPPARPQRSRGLLDLVPPLGWDHAKRLYRGEAGLTPDVRRLPAAFRHRAVIGTSLAQLAAEASEAASRPASQTEVRAAPFPSHVPLTTITPSEIDGEHAEREAIVKARLQRHRALAAASAAGRQIVAEPSGHFVHVDRPDLVIAAIEELVRRARPGSALTRRKE